MIKSRIFCVVLALLIIPFLISFTYRSVSVKGTATEIMQLARSIGLSEDDPIIVRAKEIWTEENNREQFEKDRDIVATVVFNEAGYGCSDRHMELVAAVIYNRLQSDEFPNTVYEIVTAPKQYHPQYAEADSFYGKLARESDVWEKCQEIASRALKGQIKCPKGIVYQANFTQGSKVYEKHKTSYSTTYFCYR